MSRRPSPQLALPLELAAPAQIVKAGAIYCPATPAAMEVVGFKDRWVAAFSESEVIDRDTAMDWGIAAFVAEDAGAMAADLATRLAGRAPLALAAAKQALADPAQERALFEALLDTADKAEGIKAFREKRKPEFRGS